MFFSDKQDLKKLSSSLIKLGYLIAGGDLKDLEAQKQISSLSRVVQRLDSRLRPIENLRIFEKTNLSDPMKLKIYELFLQTVGRNPVQFQHGFSFHFRNSPLPENQKASLQIIEAQAGAWAAFVIAAGALLVKPIECFQKMLTFGIFLGRTLQGLKDLQIYRAQIRAQDREFCVHYEQAFRQAQQDLSEVFKKIQADFYLPENSLAFQIAQKISLKFAH